jgi:hypothetical protein
MSVRPFAPVLTDNQPCVSSKDDSSSVEEMSRVRLTLRHEHLGAVLVLPVLPVATRPFQNNTNSIHMLLSYTIGPSREECSYDRQ